MKIGLDVMGGDYAPGAILEGAFDALESLLPGEKIVLKEVFVIWLERLVITRRQIAKHLILVLLLLGLIQKD